MLANAQAPSSWPLRMRTPMGRRARCQAPTMEVPLLRPMQPVAARQSTPRNLPAQPCLSRRPRWRSCVWGWRRTSTALTAARRPSMQRCRGLSSRRQAQKHTYSRRRSRKRSRRRSRRRCRRRRRSLSFRRGLSDSSLCLHPSRCGRQKPRRRSGSLCRRSHRRRCRQSSRRCSCSQRSQGSSGVHRYRCPRSREQL